MGLPVSAVEHRHLTKVVDGVVVDINGDPDNPGSLGHVCAKGKARITAYENLLSQESQKRREDLEI